MLSVFRRIMGLGKRSLDAAAGGRRWADDRRLPSATSLQASAATVGARAAYFAANNPIGSRIVESLVSNIIGTGIKPRSLVETEVIRTRLHRRWRAWTDAADADGAADLYGLQALLVRDMVVYGEGLAAFLAAPSGAPQLRRLHPEQLDRSITRPAGDGGIIHMGIELDRSGRRVAYWIRQSPPGDPFGFSVAPIRVPAADVVHIFRPLVAGQLRGVSWLAPVLLPAKELDALADAMLVRAKVAALFAGVVVDADGTGALPTDGAGDPSIASLEPGAMINLPPGKSIEFPDMPDQGGAAHLLTATMRLIAAGAGVTAEQASGDYSQINYSSARAALIEFRKFIESVQHHVIAFQLLRPVWSRFIRWQVLQGGVSAATYSADRSAVEAVDWLPPRWDQVDPLKDTQAAVLQIENGLKSRSEFIAERGLDAEDVDRAIAADAARLARLSVALRPASNIIPVKEEQQ
ncbi:phage portal protein [Roseiarcaceae bacterium H3SJ34-1]|uniref:phage portal protein n=1 Tax=Terripilifer ovatus TaxID=3032367 RepID=UPI003AB95D6F|nr:phage portal protein [Roseiarcaceae bacterium H3SJ34-1]